MDFIDVAAVFANPDRFHKLSAASLASSQLGTRFLNE
jgi:hypothetical protein